jgi:DNA-binding transcriptional LysR family regulator
VDPLHPPLEPLPSRELAAFAAAVDAGAIGAAADSLSLTQSAVSKRLQSLERRVGVSLLTRSHTGVHPTAAGSALYPDAKEVLQTLARAAQALHSARAACEHRLSLGASHTIGEYLLPSWLAAFTTTSPATRPHVTVTNTEGVMRAVHAHDVDIGFIPDPALREELETLRLGADELVVVVAATHPWTRARTVTPSQLASEPFVTREEGSGTRAAAIRAARAVGVQLKPMHETSSTEALKRTVARGGFTIMSALALHDERSAGQLRSLRLKGTSMRRELYAVKHRARAPGQTAARFWSWLKHAVAEAATPTPSADASRRP